MEEGEGGWQKRKLKKKKRKRRIYSLETREEDLKKINVGYKKKKED
jgi:hypothetical protein